MKVANDLVVSIHFGVSEVDGNPLDSTENGAPLDFIQGSKYLVSGLEKELEGKEVGYKFDVSLAPDQAYGEFDESLVQEIPKELFETGEAIEVGMSFMAETDQGPRTVEVTEVNEKTVSIDANHPLAGMTLQFVGEIVGIREATEKELENGHLFEESECCGGHDHEESHGCCGGDKSKHAAGESCCGGGHCH